MKFQTMEKVLKGKFAKFVKSIKDERVRDLVKENSIITGGCIVSMIQEEPINDFDLYFTNLETTQAVAEYYLKLIGGEGKDKVIIEPDTTGETRVKIWIQGQGILTKRLKKSEVDADKFVPIFVSDNAITLSDKVRIVLRFFGPAHEIHKNYDFVHCTNYWESRTGRLHIDHEALRAIVTKELRYVGSKYPIASLMRVRKFVARGWTINGGQLLKILWQASSLNLKDIDVLKDQLVGVDMTYFRWFIEALQGAIDSGTEITDGYVAELLEKIFDSDLTDYEPNTNESEEEEEEF
jgi:hypothetical protein